MTQRKEEITASSSPQNTSVPSPLSKNCWWSKEVLSTSDIDSNQQYRDFVLISEFSELEGPLPLAIVSNTTYIDLKPYTEHPNDHPLKEELKKIGLDSFDFNAFVLRVVSVDRSSEYEQIDSDILMEPMTPSSVFADSAPNSSFSIPDDTQVYFTDSENKFFAFTHHLTLFDINARGYVHPVALSYITRDPDKIVIRFEELMERFNEVAIKMKKGNYSNFTLDLKRRLLDLQFTESTVSKQQKPALSIQAIKQAITATQLMIDTLDSSISQINQSEKIQSSSSSSSSSSTSSLKEKTGDNSPKDYTPQCIDTLYPVPHFEKKLRSLAQLCQEPNEDDEEEEGKKAEKKKCHIKRPSLTQKTAKMIPLVFSIIGLQQQPNEQNNEQDDQEQQNESSRATFANAIKHDMYSEAIDSIQDMTQHFGKSSVILDVDEEEKAFIDPIHSAITFGRTFMMNMDNPQPRVDEREVEGEQKLETALDEKVESRKEDKKEQYDKKESYFSSTESDKGDLKDDDLYYDIELAATQLWKTDKTPTHLLDVLKKYQSLIVDVIFSLMTGRTVLIQGSAHNKENVKDIVHALSVFVPGQRKDRHQIIDWFDQSRLTDAEIGSIKLVGIDKENMDPSIHIEGSCVLDIDVKNGSLSSSPVYVEGQWINQLLDRILLFSSDESYIAYLHTVFMTMSLKAFIYHHLYVCDEFKIDDTPSPPTNSNTNKGYASETNSESSTLSRKWSVRLMSYLKKHEDQENNTAPEKISRPPSRSSTTSTNSVTRQSTITDDDEDYSEENQATVTLQNLLKNNHLDLKENKPRTIVGLFGSTSAGDPVTTTTNAMAKSISTASRRSSSDSSNSSTSLLNLSEDEGGAVYNSRRPPITTEQSFLNFGAEDLECFSSVQQESDSDDSSLSEVEDEHGNSKTSRRSRKNRNRRSRRLSDIGPDGVSYTERRGRRYLQEKLKVYGDDQTIVVYLATCVL